MTDPVNHPAHYTSHPSGVECIDITEHMDFLLGNALKYIWRADLKHDNPIEDLQKARFYLDRKIDQVQGLLKLPADYTPLGNLPKSEPRVWEKLADIPVGATVRDCEDDGPIVIIEEGYYRWLDGSGDERISFSGGIMAGFAPFTEVL